MGVVVKGPLDGQLRVSVGVDRLLRFVLGDRHLVRDAVGRTSAGKDEASDAVTSDGVEQAQRVHQVVLIVLGRLVDGFADVGKRGEMDDGVDAFLYEDMIEASL